MSYQGYTPSLSPLAQDQLAAGDNRFLRLDGANGGPGWLKNQFINPSFDNWQRGTSGTSNGPLADRWVVSYNGGAVTVSRRQLTPGEVDSASRYCSRIAITGQSTTPGNYCAYAQRVEGVQSLAGKRAVVRGKARCLQGYRSVYADLAQYFGAGGSSIVQPGIGTFQVGPAWTDFVMFLNVPSVSGKVLGPNVDDFVQISFTLTSDTVGRGDCTIELLDLEFKEVIPGYGDQVPPFERVPREIDLLRCQRYYESGFYNILMTATAASQYASVFVKFAPTKRVTPSLVLTTTYSLGANAANINAYGPDSMRIYTTSSGAGGLESYGTWTASAEL